MICRHVLVKGGDLSDSSDAIDIFFDGMTLILLLLSVDLSKFPSDSRRTIRALYVCLNIYFRRIRAIVCANFDNLP